MIDKQSRGVIGSTTGFGPVSLSSSLDGIANILNVAEWSSGSSSGSYPEGQMFDSSLRYQYFCCHLSNG